MKSSKQEIHMYRHHVPRRESLEKVVGMAPVKLLESKLIVFNCFKIPISNGILPENLFDPRDKCFKSTSSRRGLILPLNSFPFTEKISQLDIIEILVDSCPVSMFMSKIISLMLGQVVMAFGNVPDKKLLYNNKYLSFGKALFVIGI